MTPKFNYDDIVCLQLSRAAENRLGERAWIVGVFEDRPAGKYFQKFPPGIIYSIEFEDGSSIEAHEDDLQLKD